MLDRLKSHNMKLENILINKYINSRTSLTEDREETSLKLIYFQCLAKILLFFL